MISLHTIANFTLKGNHVQGNVCRLLERREKKVKRRHKVVPCCYTNRLKQLAIAGIPKPFNTSTCFTQLEMLLGKFKVDIRRASLCSVLFELLGERVWTAVIHTDLGA